MERMRQEPKRPVEVLLGPVRQLLAELSELVTADPKCVRLKIAAEELFCQIDQRLGCHPVARPSEPTRGPHAVEPERCRARDIGIHKNHLVEPRKQCSIFEFELVVRLHRKLHPRAGIEGTGHRGTEPIVTACGVAVSVDQ